MVEIAFRNALILLIADLTNLKKFDINKLNFKKLTHAQIAELYGDTVSVLDINKPFQEGLTMRTFESLASGKKLLTTNVDLKNYPFFSEENVMILDRDQIEVNPEFFQKSFVKIDQQTLAMMTLDSWIHCLFIADQDHYWKSYHSLFKDNK